MVNSMQDSAVTLACMVLINIKNRRFHVMKQRKAIVLNSGGADSSTCVSIAVNDEKYAPKEGAFIESTLRQLQQNTEQ